MPLLVILWLHSDKQYLSFSCYRVLKPLVPNICDSMFQFKQHTTPKLPHVHVQYKLVVPGQQTEKWSVSWQKYIGGHCLVTEQVTRPAEVDKGVPSPPQG